MIKAVCLIDIFKNFPKLKSKNLKLLEIKFWLFNTILFFAVTLYAQIMFLSFIFLHYLTPLMFLFNLLAVQGVNKKILWICNNKFFVVSKFTDIGCLR